MPLSGFNLRIALVGLMSATVAGAALQGAPLPAAGTSAAASHHALEQKNLKLVLDFSEAVFNRHEMSWAERYIPENYIQHNPLVADGRAGFIAYFKKMAALHPDSHSVILHSTVDGDLVWTHVHVSEPGKPGVVLVNIFRVANGMIVEHWDVVQPIPVTSANSNTMY